MHALWGNTTTTRTSVAPVGRPKATAKATAKGSITNKTLVPPPGAGLTPPTPPKKSGKAAKKETKKVTFAPGTGSPASPAAKSPSPSPSGRARLEQLIGDSFHTEPFPARALARFLGEVAVAGQNLQTETQELAKNLKELGTGIDAGKYDNDFANSELSWMADFTNDLEEYVASLNKKANSSPAAKSAPSPIAKGSSPGTTSLGGTAMSRFFPDETAGGPSQAFEYIAPPSGEHNTRHAARLETPLRDAATKEDYREW